MNGKGFELLEDRLAKSKASSDGSMQFDPTILITIIGAIIPLIQNCFKPKPANLRRRFLNRARVANAIRRENASIGYEAAFAEADNLFTLADKATDAELQLLIDDCCS